MEGQEEARLSTAELARPEETRRREGDPDGRDADRGRPVDGSADAPGDVDSPLLSQEETAGLRRRWDGVQTGFVDEPRKAVRDADELVAEAMKQLAESFAREREALEAQWDRGEDVSTEDLRVALQRYRSFFHRLLSA